MPVAADRQLAAEFQISLAVRVGLQTALRRVASQVDARRPSYSVPVNDPPSRNDPKISPFDFLSLRQIIPQFDAGPVAIALNRMDVGVVIRHFGRRPRSYPDQAYQAISRVWTSTLYGADGVSRLRSVNRPNTSQRPSPESHTKENNEPLQNDPSVLLVAAALSAAAAGQPPRMKMTTDIPEGIATPDRLETRIGILTSFDGVPDAKTTQLVYDNLDFQRAVQAYLNGIQIASMSAKHKGILQFGPPNTTAVLFEELMDSKALFLTPNTTSVYMMSWLEMTDEPIVVPTPPNVLGFIDDHWFKYVTDFGNAGPDKGKGGRFLILPPGYEGEVPEGYYSPEATPTAIGSSDEVSR